MISALIVTCNSERCIGPCLESLRRQAPEAEMVVVDNGSRDGTVEAARRVPGVKLIVSESNLGFAGAVNRAARESSGEALLLLNPDTLCRTSLAPLEEALQGSENVAAVAPQLVDSAGVFQRGFAIRRLPTRAALLCEILLLNRLFPNNPVNRRYRCLDFDPETAAEVEQPAGACLLVRRSSFEQCGGLDERFYPLWFEDVDLCRRLRARGGIIRYEPRVVVEHAGAHSLEGVTFSEKQVYWYRNLLYYVRKNYGRGTEALVRGALLLGMGLRIAAELLAVVLDRKTPVAVRRDRLRAYGRAALVSISAGESRPRAGN
ncbi:MAG TPA: glycosyltransferase family 2 protein [Terriglobia bacterium]|nr:glycosyltransferase family 2 protein [Terriglobia bacterium]